VLRSEGRTARVFCFQWDRSGTQIERIYIILNPDKLRAFQTGYGDLRPVEFPS
jgi:hypothetical protein